MSGIDLREYVKDENNYMTSKEAEKMFIQAGYKLIAKESDYFVIGDIHGCFDELLEVLRDWKDGQTLICLGDYMDRGKKSFQVVSLLSRLNELYPHDTIFLRGNHDQMYLDNIKVLDPSTVDFWFKNNGGKNTIKSFPITNKNQSMYNKLKAIKDEFPFVKEFLNTTRLFYETDDYIFVHAGIKPTKDWKKDTEEDDYMWIREEFHFSPNETGKKIVFGHTYTFMIDRVKFNRETNGMSHSELERYIKDNAVIYDNHYQGYLGIDTGCCVGGVLTGLVLKNGRNEEIK